jgi:hypothetical protein
MSHAPSPADRSIEELLRQLADEAGTLVRQELELARAEMAQQARQMATGAGMIGAGALLGLLSAGAGTAGVVLLLARRPRPWLAALAVSGAYAGAGVLLAREGQRRIRAVGAPLPRQTAQTLKETPRWPTTPPGSART